MFACLIGGVTIYAGGALSATHVDVSRIIPACRIVCAVLLFFVEPIAKSNVEIVAEQNQLPK